MNTAIVDANVFIHGRGSYPFSKAITVQEVVDELKTDHGKNMLHNTNYEVRRPSKKSIEKVREKSERINSPTSKEDERLLSLAMDLDQLILTDDIALQNLALHLGIGFQGFLEDKITEKFKWESICKNCGNEVSKDRCSSCGSTRLRRKQVRCS